MDLQAQLDALDAAIAGGVKVTQFDGHRVEYQSTADMIAARAQLVARIAQSRPSGRKSAYFPAYDSGL